MTPQRLNPYVGNVLIDRMRPILSPEEALEILTYLPEMPEDIANIPRYIRLHYLQVMRDLHIASREEARLSTTFDSPCVRLLVVSSWHLVA